MNLGRPPSPATTIHLTNTEIHQTIDKISSHITATVAQKEQEVLKMQADFLQKKEREIAEIIAQMEFKNAEKHKDFDEIRELKTQVLRLERQTIELGSERMQAR